VLNLSASALRSARAVGVLVRSGYEPEAQALHRRLTEAHTMLQLVLDDPSGEKAQRWLQDKGPGKPRSLAQQAGHLDTFDLYSESAHATYIGLRRWSTLDAGDGLKMVLPHPYRQPEIGNPMLLLSAAECRDFAAMIGKVFLLSVPDLRRLDADLAESLNVALVPEREGQAST
jgi:uncharacterized protein DUF5677